MHNINGNEIWCINQVAARELRKDLITDMRKVIEKLDPVDSEELLDMLEEEANRFEELFLELFQDNEFNKSKAPRIPVFDFAPNF